LVAPKKEEKGGEAGEGSWVEEEEGWLEEVGGLKKVARSTKVMGLKRLVRGKKPQVVEELEEGEEVEEREEAEEVEEVEEVGWWERKCGVGGSGRVKEMEGGGRQ
jgi:hypothetical protein